MSVFATMWVGDCPGSQNRRIFKVSSPSVELLRAAPDGGGCWSPAKLSPLAADVTATSPSRQSVTGERPGGLEPAAASVLEPAGRRRLGTGTCD